MNALRRSGSDHNPYGRRTGQDTDRRHQDYATVCDRAGRRSLTGISIDMLAKTFERQGYAIALLTDSQWREPINRELLHIINSDSWQATLLKYLN